MELSEFINETLSQIIKGVHESQQKATEYGAHINPSPGHPNSAKPCNLTPVSFNVALNVTKESEGKTGAQIEVATIFKAGASGGMSTSSSSTHNISFIIDVILPIDEGSKSIVEIEKAKLKELGRQVSSQW
jgi:hypothetical protein